MGPELKTTLSFMMSVSGSKTYAPTFATRSLCRNRPNPGPDGTVASQWNALPNQSRTRIRIATLSVALMHSWTYFKTRCCNKGFHNHKFTRNSFINNRLEAPFNHERSPFERAGRDEARCNRR